MRDRYEDQEARRYIDQYGGVVADLAIRVYTSRLIGAETDLVLHGGGNTSVKTTFTNILDEEIEVICVKGSGWDLGDIEPQGLPALDLEYLRKLRVLESLTDEEMVNQFRTHLLDASSPNPSIETLVHAFLPHKFIDHTHADAIVTLTNQPEAERLLREAQVPIGLLSTGTHFRVVYAPRGENAGTLTFPISAMVEVAGRPILSAFEMLFSSYRLLAAPSGPRDDRGTNGRSRSHRQRGQCLPALPAVRDTHTIRSGRRQP